MRQCSPGAFLRPPSPEWYFYDAFCEKQVGPKYRAQAYRFVAGAPSAYSLRGSPGGQGFAYQFAARASPLVFLLASVWVGPTVSDANRVMAAGAVARALGACDREMTRGS